MQDESNQNDVAISALKEIFYYIEDLECNKLNLELLNFVNEVQFKIERKVQELQSTQNEKQPRG